MKTRLAAAAGVTALALLRPPAGAAPPASSPPAPARAAFDRFKALAGSWVGKSTKGWTDRADVKVIARGSAVVSTSDFEAHPGEAMLTVIHLDGERLLLTHYCVARNQPRLVASAFEDGGKTIRFRFLDATNLPSPAAGHMHSVVFRFLDDDHYTSRWSFFSKGKEDWMEEITFERAAPEVASRAATSGD